MSCSCAKSISPVENLAGLLKSHQIVDLPEYGLKYSTSLFHYGHPPAPPAIMFYRCSFDLLFFRHLISEVSWPVFTKLCHMVDGDPDLWNSVRHFRDPFPRNLAAQKRQILAQFRTILHDHEYLWNVPRYRQSENDVANYGHSHTHRQT